jgi:cyanophycin synthetase
MPASHENVQAPLRAGYLHSLSQPSFTRSIAIECPPLVPFQAIDDWLAYAFDIKVVNKPALAFSPQTSNEAVVAGLVWRVMHLSAALLQAVRVPAFDVGRILALNRKRPGSSTWQLMLALPQIDYVPDNLYTFAHQSAAKGIAWLIAHAQTPENVGRLFFDLDEQFVKKYVSLALGGDSTISVLKEVWNKGIEFRHLGNGTYQLGMGAKQLRVDRGAVQFDSAIGSRIAVNKWRSANLARDAGLPAPTHRMATTEETALAIAHRLGWPVVVKPLDRDRGEGVTVDIRSDQQLVEAFKRAMALSRAVLVEQQVAGICHRVLVANGKVRLAAKWLPKSVMGDGHQTVRALVEQANAGEQAKPPWSRLRPFPLDEMAIACLANARLTPDSVPAKGVMAPLRPIQTMEWGGILEDLTDSIHPENAVIAIKAAHIFGLAVAGIDIISTNITRPWHENGAIINEVNFSPMLSGRQTGRVIASLLDEWLVGGGNIPVHAVIGGESAMAKGLRIRADYAARGVRCWLTSHLETVSDSGDSYAVAANGLFERCMALLMDPNIEALVMVIQTDELLTTGLPTSRIERIHDLLDSVTPPSVASPKSHTTPERMTAIRKLLLAHSASIDETTS